MKKNIPYILILCGITVLFFYKTFFQGLLPFPGDLLISEYQPWKSYSYLGYNPGSYPSKKQYFDTIRQIYPWRTFVNQELKQGKIPLWNPYNFSGHPLMANLQSQVFYPLTFLYFIFSQPTAWSILVVVQPLFSAIGMFLYLTAIKRSTGGALLGSVSYGFCLFMTVFLEYNTIGHVIVWVPFLLFSLEYMKISPKIVYRILFVFSLVASSLAGHLQIFGALLLFQVAYAIFVIRSKKALIEMGILTCISLGIAAIQLIPTFELLRYSARANHDYQDLLGRLLLQPKQLLTVLNPDIFGNPATGNYLLTDSYPGKALFIGSIAFFFALVGICHRKKDQVFSFFSVTAVLLLVIVTNNPLTQIMYRFPILFLSQSAPGNFLFLLSFCAAALAAYGIDLWIYKKIPITTPLVIVSILMALLWIGFIIQPESFNSKMIFFGSGMFAFLLGILLTNRFVSKKQFIVLITILLTTGELWYSFQKFNPFVPRELFYPRTAVADFIYGENSFKRIFGYGAGSIEANFATQLSIYDSNGYDPLYPKDYGAFIYSSSDGNVPKDFDRNIRSDARIAPGFGQESFDNNEYRRKILNLLSVGYIINKEENGTTEKTFVPNIYPVIYKKDGFIIHKNEYALPKAYLVSTIVTENKNKFSNIFHSEDFDISSMVFLEEHSATPLASSSGSALLSSYAPGKITVEVNTEGNKFLFLSETYMPGWEAFIDSIKTPIYKANTTFLGVFVPEGSHRVTFQYNPDSFKTGSTISILSIVGLLIYLLWRKITNIKSSI